MSKPSRQQRRLQEQAQIATDLNMLQSRPFLIAGIQVDAIEMMTPQGKTPGSRITFTMQNGATYGPIIFDPIMTINLIAAMTAALQGRPGPGPQGPPEANPGAHNPSSDDPSQVPLDNVTPSGLIVP